MRPTAAQMLCLRQLFNRNGEGIVDRYGSLICAGDKLSAGAATLVRLISRGLLYSPGPDRVALTDKARKLMKAKP